MAFGHGLSRSQRSASSRSNPVYDGEEGFSGTRVAAGYRQHDGLGIRGSVTVRAIPHVVGAVKLHVIKIEAFLIGVKS